MEEIWVDVENYNGRYQVSNFGGVRCFLFNKIKLTHPVFISKEILRSGHLRVELGGKKILVHRLVAQAFIPNTENKPFINHLDGNPSNNKVENLEWCTPKENTQHAFKTGLMVGFKGADAGNAKLTEEEVIEIYKLFNEKIKTGVALSKKYGVTTSAISRIIKGKTWKHLQLNKTNELA